MSTDREDYARLSELLDRLVMSGPKAAHVSASETHEIHDDGMACIEEVAALRAQVEALTRERNILRAALSGEPYALEQENARLRRERYDAMCMVEALRENYAAMMKKLTDPIVREKMLHPGPPIIKAEAHTLIAERDAALARAEKAERERDELRAIFNNAEKLPDDDAAWMNKCAAAIARAEKAEADAARLVKVLRRARRYLRKPTAIVPDECCQHSSECESFGGLTAPQSYADTVEQIDALLAAVGVKP